MNRKCKRMYVLLLLFAMFSMLASCGKNTDDGRHTSNKRKVKERQTVSTADKEKIEEEARTETKTKIETKDVLAIQTEDQLRGILSEETSESILNFVYDDFDKNGDYEAVAFCGVEHAEDRSFYGTLYLITGKGVKTIRETDSYWDTGSILDVGSEKIVFINKYSTSCSPSYIYQIRDSEVIEIEGSGEGNSLLQDADGRICMTDSEYDATVDGTGHTWNTYYFYWDNGFFEYGAAQMPVNEFSNYDGADIILNKIAADGYDIKSILRRQNGIININCSDGVYNVNVRALLDNGLVKSMPVTEGGFYESGIIKTEMLPQIATYPDMSAYDAYDVIIKEYETACSVPYDEWNMRSADYSNLNLNILDYYHVPSHYDDMIDSDEPYEIWYFYYDIDNNGVPELVLNGVSHEPWIFAIYAFDGKKAVELSDSKNKASCSYGLFTNGVIVSYGDDCEYYTISKNGSTLEPCEMSDDEVYELLKYQFIGDNVEWTCLAADIPAQ